MLEGIVNVLKPPGLTSSDVVTDLRRIFDTKRVGHAGTLDPGAAGVLTVCVGRATRLFDYLVDKKKEYIAEIAFGAATDTQDSYGRVIAESDRAVSKDDVCRALEGFHGDVRQSVPIYSALNQNGVKLYKLARSGEKIEPKVRDITVYETEYLANTGENRHLVRIVCSKGTYIRTVCHDIGEAVGGCAYMSFLLRTASGDFRIENAHSVAELRLLKEQDRLNEAVVPMDAALCNMPELRLNGLSERQRTRLLNGADINCGMDAPCGKMRIYIDGVFEGLGTADGGKLKMCLMLGE